MPMARTDNNYIGVDISVPLYSGGVAQANIREATSQKEIAANELRQTELKTSENVRRAYLQVQSSETIVAAAKQFLESAELNATAMRQGFELSAVTSVDLLNALRDRYRAERNLQRVKYDQIKSLLTLKHETGILGAQDLLEVGTWLSPAN